MAQRDSILPNRDEPIFPITDRKTPILDRIKNNEGETLAEQLGERVGEIAIAGDEERLRVLKKSREDFREALSNSLGVDQGALDDDVVGEMTRLFGEYREDDLLDDGFSDTLGDTREEDGEDNGEDSPF